MQHENQPSQDKPTLKDWNDPKLSSMACAIAPSGSPPASGAMLVQKMVWFKWPPPLNLIAGRRAFIAFTSLAASASTNWKIKASI